MSLLPEASMAAAKMCIRDSMIPGGAASNRFRFNIADVHRRLIILKMRVAQAFVVFAEQQYPKGTLAVSYTHLVKTVPGIMRLSACCWGPLQPASIGAPREALRMAAAFPSVLRLKSIVILATPRNDRARRA